MSRLGSACRRSRRRFGGYSRCGQKRGKGGRLLDPSLVICSSNERLLSTHCMPGTGGQWRENTRPLTNHQVSRPVSEVILITDEYSVESEQGGDVPE